MGIKRTTIARVAAGLSFICGLIGLLAGLSGYSWKLGSVGWFMGGVLLALIAVFILVDGWVSFERHRIIVVPKA